MKNVLKLTAATGAAVTAAALFPALANAATTTDRFPADGAGVVFAQTDGLTGNQVVAFDRATDGTLSQAGTYATGGVGGQLTGSVVDHTASQGAVAYDASANLLYTVNAGSDTITVFAVHGDQLTRLQVISSGGQFPVSITRHGSLVFVLNARGGGSISGFLRVGRTLVAIPSWHRELGFNPNPSPEFTSTPAEVSFSPNGAELVVATKGDGSGFSVFRVGVFGPSATPTVTTVPGAVPFGFGFDEYGHLVASEAGTNAAATFALGRHGAVTELDTALTAQHATCWAVVAGDKTYVSNAGSGNLTGYQIGEDGSLTLLGNFAAEAGTVDAAASPDGKFLYVENGAGGVIDTFSIGQNGTLTKLGNTTLPGGAGAEGIAVAR
jgi:6-phosphogluconolactonase (cycloisomerase 2 family)